MRDLGDVGREQAGEPGERLDREPGHLADDRGEHPQPHHRRHRRQRQEVRGQRGQRDRLEVVRHQRRRRERRRDRHRGALGERRAASRPPASRPRPTSRSVADAGREQQDPDHRGEAELPADVAARAGVERRASRRRRAASAYQRERGRPARAATTPAAPMIPARWIDGPGAGDRDVEGDQREHADEPGAQRHAEQRRAAATASSASSITFSPQTASRCASPERLKSSTVAGSIRSSSPSTKPRRSAASGAGVPRPERRLGAIADASTTPASPPRRRR